MFASKVVIQSYGKIIVVVSLMCWHVLLYDWLNFWELPVVVRLKIVSLLTILRKLSEYLLLLKVENKVVQARSKSFLCVQIR